MTVERNPQESELDFHKRIIYGKLVDKTLSDYDYSELAPMVYGQEYSTDVARRMFYGSCKTLQLIDEQREKGVVDRRLVDELADKKMQIELERQKLRTEKMEYNRYLREDARDEMFMEEVLRAIRENMKEQVPIKSIPIEHREREGMLCIADCHFGKEFKLYGVLDEVLNEYSPEVFYQRMETLLSYVVDTVEREGLEILHVYNLGDSVDGFLRHSQAFSLRYGVIDSAILFGNYMGDWLRELSKHVNVVYGQTDGNHDELRLIDGRKGAHLNESAGKVVLNCIKLKNEDNPNFQVVENKTGMIYDYICDFSILGIHGEVKDMQHAINEFEMIYSVPISYLVAGHKHEESFSNCGVRKGVIRSGSIIGIDDYSMTIRKSSDACASLTLFERGFGKTIQYTYVLN